MRGLCDASHTKACVILDDRNQARPHLGHLPDRLVVAQTSEAVTMAVRVVSLRTRFQRAETLKAL